MVWCIVYVLIVLPRLVPEFLINSMVPMAINIGPFWKSMELWLVYNCRFEDKFALTILLALLNSFISLDVWSGVKNKKQSMKLWKVQPYRNIFQSAHSYIDPSIQPSNQMSRVLVKVKVSWPSDHPWQSLTLCS